MYVEAAAVIILTATCAALSYFSFRRNRDPLLATALGILVFAAFLVGSVLRPVGLTAKRMSFESTVANRINDYRAYAPMDQQALDNLPNIPVPAQGQIDFIGVRRGAIVAAASTPKLRLGQQVELRGWIADPLGHSTASGLFVILNASDRIDSSAGYGLKRSEISSLPAEFKGTKVGFVVDVPASLMRKGSNQLELGAVATDQRGFFKLPDRVTVTVAER